MTDVTDFLDTIIQNPPKKVGRLEYITAVLEDLGNPQNNAPAIHITGTSGKGSTAYYATALLHNAGYSTGTFTSPHITSVAERSLINRFPLPEEKYLAYFQQFQAIYVKMDLHLSYFEFLTVFSFWLFAQEQVDYMVIEVGVGGRLDTTNVMSRPKTVRVITDIGIDHTELLGETVAEIAMEKAGIIHPGDLVVINHQSDEVMRTIKKAAEQQQARLLINETLDIVDGLPKFQQRNWSLAKVAVDQRLAIDKQPPITKKIADTSSQITIPGRFDRRIIDDVEIILDVAHNPQKVQGLVDALLELYPGQKPVFVVAFGGNKQKSLADSLHIINEHASYVVATSFEMNINSYSSISAEIVSHHTSVESAVQDNSADALHQAITKAREYGTYVIVTGSFYLISDVYKKLPSTGIYGGRTGIRTPETP